MNQRRQIVREGETFSLYYRCVLKRSTSGEHFDFRTELHNHPDLNHVPGSIIPSKGYQFVYLPIQYADEGSHQSHFRFYSPCLPSSHVLHFLNLAKVSKTREPKTRMTKESCRWWHILRTRKRLSPSFDRIATTLYFTVMWISFSFTCKLQRWTELVRCSLWGPCEDMRANTLMLKNGLVYLWLFWNSSKTSLRKDRLSSPLNRS